MAFIDDLETEPAPKLIGRCSIVPPTSRYPHGLAIYADDIEAVELEKGKGFACAECVKRLLAPKPVSQDPDPAKGRKRKSGTGARLSKGPVS